MKAADARAMTLDQLDDEVVKLKKEQFNLRFQRATGQLANTARVRAVRRDIALMKTIAAQKRAAKKKKKKKKTEIREADQENDSEKRKKRGLKRRGIRGFEMPKRTLQGVVVSDKQDKTIVVRVERRFTHATMKKTVRRSKKYHAHDETNEYAVGDVVWIEERRPLSKLKCWEVVRGEKKAKVQ